MGYSKIRGKVGCLTWCLISCWNSLTIRPLCNPIWCMWWSANTRTKCSLAWMMDPCLKAAKRTCITYSEDMEPTSVSQLVQSLKSLDWSLCLFCVRQGKKQWKKQKWIHSEKSWILAKFDTVVSEKYFGIAKFLSFVSSSLSTFIYIFMKYYNYTIFVPLKCQSDGGHLT